MFGLAYLLFFAVYLLLSLAVVVLAGSWAGRRKRSRLLWGGVAVLLMYNLVFWDWLPTVYVHKYYCEKEAGFWIYKTLDQWKAENPGGRLSFAEYAVRTEKEVGGYTETHPLNQRLNWVIKLRETSNVLQVAKREESLVDTKNNETLIRFVDFSRGDQRSTGTIKSWLVRNDCNGGEVYRVRMGQLIDEIYADIKGDKK